MLKLKNILLEQSDNLSIIEKAIINKLPLTINYGSESTDVLNGIRIVTYPIVLGTHITSGNLVFWAYVTKGVSLRGIPNWKMFRVDRVLDAYIDANAKPFKLESLPNYEKYKAPEKMNTLGQVFVYSPVEDEETITPEEPTAEPIKQKEPITPKEPAKPEELTKPEEPTTPEEPEKIPTEPLPTTKDVIIKPEEPDNKKIIEPIIDKEIEGPTVNPETEPLNLEKEIEDVLNKSHKIINNKKFISNNDFKNLQISVYSKLENEWKNYQRQIGKNAKPGEGTRNRLVYLANKQILDKLKSTNTTIDAKGILSEMYEIIRRFKLLI